MKKPELPSVPRVNRLWYGFIVQIYWKKTDWERWSSFDDVTADFLELSSGLTAVNDDTAWLTKRFVIFFYDQISMNTIVTS